MRDKILIAIVALLIAVCVATPSFAFGPFGMTGAPPAGGGGAVGFVGDNTASSAGDGSPGTEPYSNKAVYSCYAATTTGTVSYIHALTTASASGSYNAAIYSSDLGTKLAEGNLTAGPGTGRINITLDSPISVDSGTTYCIAFGSSDDGYWKLGCANVIGTHVYEDSSYTVGDSMPTSMTQDADLLTHYRLILWADGSSS
jgi:hypothetical protein